MTAMDELNGRQGSEAPSSSSSDFYATDSPNMQPTCAIVNGSAMDHNGQSDATDGPVDDLEEDSSAEMDLSDSRSPSPEPQSHSTTHAELRAASFGISPEQPLKRKLSEEGSSALVPADISTQGVKKLRLSAPPPEQTSAGAVKALDLPVELWQQIFLHLSPNNLARCLRVCRTLKGFSTKTIARPTANKAEAKDLTKVRSFDSEAIWANARKTCHPTMPRPLTRLTELQMLQLIGNTKCQFCAREPALLQATSPFNCGPGQEGVRVIWPFGIRTCGSCLESYTLKDIEVLKSNAGSLRNGLPYCFLTPDLHFVPEIQRTQVGGIPAHLHVSKVYYRPDIQNIVDEYSNATSLGAGAAEEWKKGLIARGKEAMADAARWEQWESQMPPGTMSQVLREYDVPFFSNSVGPGYSSAAVPNGAQPPMVVNVTHLLPQPMPQKAAKPKTAQDVEEARSARKADIERRCRELSPPLDASALQHMPSFQATMQIAQPMSDNFWDSFLKPRILAERETAEATERMRQDHLVWLQAAMPHHVQDEPYTRPAKEVYDKEYERAQEPLRARLGEYADDFSQNHWNGGTLDKFNSPVFAVKIIEFVDRRYREDKLAGNLPPPGQVPRGNNQGGPFPEPFLSLNNMKWLFDHKIRPRTDPHCRELFLCAGCMVDAKQPKWLAFEGLIQHYGAKHTTDFSHNNVVVQWQTSEWPSDLPFVRDPTYYMKQKKEATEPRGQGRPRRTPQTSNGPFNAPGNGRLPSENPLFASYHQSAPSNTGYYPQAPEYAAYQNGQSQQQAVPYGWQPQPDPSNAQQSESSYDTQLNTLCSDISAVWTGLEGIKDDMLLQCILVQTTIHHSVARFEAQFGRIPNLDLLTDVLTTKPEVRPFKEAHGLACKLCVAAQTDGSAGQSTYYARIASVKLFNTASLVSHANIVHMDQGHRKPVDWTQSMIELPEAEVLSRLLRTPGMDDDKLETIAKAFPTAFPWPLPKIGHITEQQAENPLVQKMLDRHFKKKGDPPKKKKKGQHGTNGTPAREESEPLPEAREDEYDPRRPIALGMDDRAQHMFPPGTTPQSATTFNFAPETLAALSQLSASTTHNQQPAVDSRAERSPSVGRSEPAKPAPNISEILAKLTGQVNQPQPQPQSTTQSFQQYAPSQQTATPPDTTSRTSSQPKYMYTEPHGAPQQVSPRRYVDERPVSHRFAQQPAYRSSTEPSPRYEVPEASLAQSYNARQFEHNRSHSYVESTQPQASRTPPRYRPAYEETPQYAQPAQYTPVYRPEPPTQYVQVHSDRDRYAPTYQHYAQPPPPEPKYVDEYGRELKLVPVDAAPAPIQYAPHPIEQPHQQYARHAPPPGSAYAGSPPAPQYAPYPYDDRRPVYYEATGAVAPPVEQRYGYEEMARGSVPRR